MEKIISATLNATTLVAPLRRTDANQAAAAIITEKAHEGKDLDPHYVSTVRRTSKIAVRREEAKSTTGMTARYHLQAAKVKLAEHTLQQSNQCEPTRLQIAEKVSRKHKSTLDHLVADQEYAEATATMADQALTGIRYENGVMIFSTPIEPTSRYAQLRWDEMPEERRQRLEEYSLRSAEGIATGIEAICGNSTLRDDLRKLFKPYLPI